MTSTSVQPSPGLRSRPRAGGQGGPPLGILAVVFTVPFVAGVVLSAAIAGGKTFPSPYSDAAGI
jgi:hypothetical protein